MAQPSSAALHPIFLALPPEQIVLLKSLLESHEFVGELRTLDADAGLVVVLALAATEGLVREMLSAEKGRLQVREVPRPEHISGDWLMAELD